ncbi:uncharacterized protein FIBRA_05683 [Fibroporia radiculosa]|uniref:Uncharacterized protein n=1 Tax=Fibroporia radiculosa TaxID=599839 RepID=J4HXY2_9APHY|nr:uncharacterized protein FIBRA_05683 [Fibroporia radiculosa]CCM03547.1 predicted protein [Fibroporia radiculosa]
MAAQMKSVPVSQNVGLEVKNYAATMEILDEGFLVQYAGINPETGKIWKPMWDRKEGRSFVRSLTLEDKSKRVLQWYCILAGFLNLAMNLPEPLAKEMTVLPKCAMSSGTKANLMPNEAVDSHDLEGASQKKMRREADGSPQLKEDKARLRARVRKPTSIFIPNKSRTVSQSSMIHRQSRGIVFSKDPDPEVIQAVSQQTDNSRMSLESGLHWMLDPIISSKKGMAVEIRGTAGDSGWFQGQYEDQQGAILSSFITGSSSFASTACT